MLRCRCGRPKRENTKDLEPQCSSQTLPYPLPGLTGEQWHIPQRRGRTQNHISSSFSRNASLSFAQHLVSTCPTVYTYLILLALVRHWLCLSKPHPFLLNNPSFPKIVHLKAHILKIVHSLSQWFSQFNLHLKRDIMQMFPGYFPAVKRISQSCSLMKYLSSEQFLSCFPSDLSPYKREHSIFVEVSPG